jgi:hypothetical protein
MNDTLRWTKDPEIDEQLDALERGKRYMIIWTNNGRRTDRMSVLKFLGTDAVGGNTAWDARPDAGTQNIPRDWILRVEKASLLAKVILDERAPVPLADATDVKPKPEMRVVHQHCGKRQQHEEHVTRVSREQGWRLVCPGELEDLTQSADVGVRWQAQMEELIGSARGAGNEAMRMLNMPQGMRDPIVEKQIRFRVGVAQAHATAALALAISNGIGDLEPPLTKLSTLTDTVGGENRFVAAAIKAWRSTEAEVRS